MYYIRDQGPIIVHKLLLASITLHLLLFGVLYLIRLEGKGAYESPLPVSLVKRGKEELKPRAIPIKEILLPDMANRGNYAPANEDAKLTRYFPAHVSYFDSQENETFHGIGIADVPLRNETVHNLNTFYRPDPVRPPAKISLENSRTQVNTSMIGETLLKNIERTELVKLDPSFDLQVDLAMRRFLEIVRKRIESKKRYPRSAREMGLEGRSGVKLTILKDGSLENVEITESSGNELLDNAALESIRRAAPFPPIPESIERNKIDISVYIVFKINSSSSSS